MILIACTCLLLILGVSTSFAGDVDDTLQVNNETGMEPVSMSDESVDDSSHVENDVSAEGNALGSSMDTSNDILKETEGNFSELNDLISANTNGTVDLYKGYSDSSYDSSGIVIDKEITIDGHNNTLDRKSAGTIFKVNTESKVVFKNLIFENANDSAIIFEKEAHVDFINCKFIDNYDYTVRLTTERRGMAIHFKSGLTDSSFTDVTFKGNGIYAGATSSDVYGGAISVDGDAIGNKFSRVTFSKNFILYSKDGTYFGEMTVHGFYGGAIAFKRNATNNNFTSVNFVDNRLTETFQGKYDYDWKTYTLASFAGAIYYAGDAVNNNFVGCYFNNNDGSSLGGAITVKGTAENCSFINSTFSNNEALYDQDEYNIVNRGMGGAVYMDSARNVTFDNVDFMKNSATYGGAVYIKFAQNVTFENVNFTENTAEVSSIFIGSTANSERPYTTDCGGGAVYIRSDRSSTFYNVYFKSNQAITTNGGYSELFSTDGGAVKINSANNTVFNKTVFEENSAIRQGGAVYMGGAGKKIFVDVNFTRNSINSESIAIASAAYIVGGNGNFTNVNFDQNYVYNMVKYYHSHYSRKTCRVDGGLLYIIGSNYIFNNVNFTNNEIRYSSGMASSDFVRGIVYLQAKNVNFTNVKFTGNVNKFGLDEEYCGSTIYSDSSNNVRFDNAVFKYNSDNFRGPVVLNGGSNFIFNRTVFTDNPSNMYSAIYSTASGVSIINSVIENNTCAGNTAVVYLKGNNGCLKNTNFTNNFINITGKVVFASAVYINGNGYNISDVNFKNNWIESSSNVYGGAGYFAITNSQWNNVNFIENYVKSDASAYGSAAYLQLTNSVWNNSNVINNTFILGKSNSGPLHMIDSGNVTFENCNFVNNSNSQSGSAISSIRTSNIAFNHCNFTNNALVDNNLQSGVIYNEGSLEVFDCNFIGNNGSSSIIYVSATYNTKNCVNISDSIFDSVSKDYVIYSTNSKFYLDNVDFNNYKLKYVIYASNAKDGCITNANFINNNGSGIVYLPSSSMTFRNVNFTNNTANVDTVVYTGWSLTVASARFINNYGSMGGVCRSGYDLNVTDSTFINNKALGNGGALYSSGYTYLDNVYLDNNTATGGAGGALYGSSYQKLVLNNVVMTNNRADQTGGAVHTVSPVISIADSSFVNNTAAGAGGALYFAQKSDISIIKSNFTNNLAKKTAGALYISKNSESMIKDSNFTNNSATRGSAIDNNGKSLNISSTEFLKNKANSIELSILFDKYTNATTVIYAGGDNYVNAIQSNENISFVDVTYFEYGKGTVTSEIETPLNSYYKQYQNITFEVYDENATLLETHNLVTDGEGKAYVETIHYNRDHIVAYRLEDDYYRLINSTRSCTYGDFTILQRLINSLHDNEVLELTRTYTYTINEDEMTEGIIINRTNITINGNGHTINALFQSRIFQLLTSNVKFYNINFVNASGLEGAFIYGIDVNNTEIINCTFANNFTDIEMINPDVINVDPIDPNPGRKLVESSLGIGGADLLGDTVAPIYWDPSEPIGDGEYDYMDPSSMIGGAVYIVGTNLTVLNSNFTSIVARLGGSIYFEGVNGIIDNCNFNSTKAIQGGAIFAYASNVNITGSTFHHNIAELAGGAILAIGEEFIIDDCTFIDCFITQQFWGDIEDYMFNNDQGDDSPPVTGDRMHPKSMSTGDLLGEGDVIVGPVIPVDPRGGLIVVDPIEGGDENGVSAIGDYIGGGAIYTGVPGIKIRYSRFELCYAESFGGAIFANAENTNISHSNFTSGYSTSGGAILIAFEANNSIVDNCKFDDNIALQNGGAISWYGVNGTLTSSVFNRNGQLLSMERGGSPVDGGGAVFWNSLNGTIDNCNFTGNTVCFPYGNYTFEGLENEYGEVFQLNEYDLLEFCKNPFGYGGAILVKGYFINITNSNFKDNTAQSGGAIAIIEVNFEGLTPEIVYAGDLDQVPCSNINVIDCTFTNNFAQYAGALLVASYNTTVVNCEFTSNTAFVAGAVNLQGISTTIENSTFRDNSAYAAGAMLSGYISRGDWGMITLLGYNNTVKNSTFIDNFAHYGGAVIWMDDDGVICDNSHFTGNGINDAYSRYSKRFNETYMFEVSEGLFAVIPEVFESNLGVIQASPFSGGAVYWIGEMGVINDTDFAENSAIFGGALYWEGDTGNLNNVTFKDNYGFTGDKVPAVSTFVSYTLNTMSKNQYYYYRVDIEKELEANLEDAKLNIPGDDPYYIYGYGYSNGDYTNYYGNQNVVLTYIFGIKTQNSMPLDKSCGGAIYWKSIGSFINGVTFINNYANVGGAAYVEAPYVIIFNSTLDENNAFEGGAIFWNGEEGYILNTTLNENKAVGYSDVTTFEAISYGLYELPVDTYSSDAKTLMDENIENILTEMFETHDVDKIQIISYSLSEGKLQIIFELTNYLEYNISAPSKGGAIYSGADKLKVENVTFSNNSASLGGALYVDSLDVHVLNVTMDDNHASLYTETILVTKEKYLKYVVPCEDMYSKNREELKYANAIDVMNTVSNDYKCDNIRIVKYLADYDKNELIYLLALVSVELYNGSDASYGGGIYLKADGASMEESTFTHNSAVYGGAVYINGENANIYHSIFEDNNVFGSKGIYISENEVSKYYKIEFEQPDGDAELHYGDLDYALDKNFTYYLIEAYEKYSADLIKVDYEMDYYGSYFWEDYYELTIYGYELNITLINYEFDVVEESYGGAVYVNGNNAVIEANSFKNNSGIYGGAVYTKGSQTIIYNDTFTSNEANMGGALYTKGNSTGVFNSTFALNTAVLGGAIYWNGKSGIIDENSKFFNNTALQGGAVYYKANGNKIANSEFRYNKADYGSALYVVSDDLTIESSSLLENRAKAVSLISQSEIIDDEIILTAVFKGNDNLMNAIYTLNMPALDNVVYWGENGLTNTANCPPEIKDLEEGINITLMLLDSSFTETTIVNMTNLNGEVRVALPIRNGRYFVALSHVEDNYYTEISNNEVIHLGTCDAPIDLNVNDILYKENATVEIVLPSDVTGNVTIEIDGENYTTVNVTGGIVNVNVPNLASGGYNVTVYYSGDETFTKNSTSTTFKVYPIKASLNVTTDGGNYSENIPVHISLSNNCTGKIIITIDDNYGNTLNITNSTDFEITLSNLDAGSYNITAYYTGDDNYLPVFASATLTVNPIEIDVEASAKDITTAENATFDISLLCDFSGKVNVTMDNISNVYDVSASTKLIFANLTAGAKSAKLQFYGDKNYIDKSVNVTFNVTDDSADESEATLDAVIGDTTYLISTFANVTLSKNMAGNVTIVIGDKTFNGTVTEGWVSVVIDGLSAGFKTANISFVSEDGNVKLNGTAKFVVYQAMSQITIEADGFDVVANVTDGAAGTVTFNIDGVEYEIDIEGNTARLPSKLTNGVNKVVAVYNGDVNYTASSTSANYTILANSSVTVTVNNIVYRNNAVIVVQVGNGQKGFVTVTVAGENYTEEIRDGFATVNVSGLVVDEYNVTVRYLGDDIHMPIGNETSFRVEKAKLDASVIGLNVTTDEKASFVVTVPCDFKGKVNITVDGNNYSRDVSANIVLGQLAEGHKTATFIFYSDNNYNGTTVESVFDVTKIVVKTVNNTVNAQNMTRGWNSPYDYQAAFLDIRGNALVNANVSFIVNGKSYNVRTNEDGIAQLNTSKLAVGTYNVTSFNMVTGEKVTRQLTIVERLIKSNKTLVMDFSDGSNYVVKVIGDDGNLAPAGEIVSITVNGVSYACKVDKNGLAKLKIRLNPKTYKVVAEYKKFKVNNKIIVKQTLKLVKKTVTVKKSAKKFVLKATLKWSNGKAIKGKKITFKFKGKKYTVKTNSKGVAQVTLSKSILKKLKKGKTYAYSAKYITNIIKGSVKVK